MDESDTYLMILDEGRMKGFRWVILTLGEDQFGPPDASVRAGLQNITDLDRLKRIARRTPQSDQLAGNPGYPLSSCPAFSPVAARSLDRAAGPTAGFPSCEEETCCRSLGRGRRPRPNDRQLQGNHAL